MGLIGSMGSSQKQSKENFPLVDRGLKPLWFKVYNAFSKENLKTYGQ
jgi:hypothetical protein